MNCCKLLLTTVFLCVPAWASESYKPPEGGDTWQKANLYLEPVGLFKKASGVTVFACNMAETQHRCQLYAKNVRPRALYTLWIVDMEGFKVKRTHELTSRWRPLRADKRGVLYFTGNLPWCPVGRDAFVVKYHPNERRHKFSDGITVLKGYLVKVE